MMAETEREESAGPTTLPNPEYISGLYSKYLRWFRYVGAILHVLEFDADKSYYFIDFFLFDYSVNIIDYL